MPSSELVFQIIQGPMVCAAFIVFAAGLVWQTITLSRFTRKTSPAETVSAPGAHESGEASKLLRQARLLGALKTTALGASPVLSAVSIIFHVCLFITPIFLMGHSVLLKARFGIGVPSFSEGVSDLLSIIVLSSGLFFLLRRLLLSRVRALTTFLDIVLLFAVLLPFLTGFLAHHRLLLDYRLMIALHILSGELMLVIIPFSKFFHMIFFFFGRFLIVNEYSLGRPKRRWQF